MGSVLIAQTPKGPLGCGTYSVKLVNAGQTILESHRVTSVVWGRRTGEPSTCTVTIPVRGKDLVACCEGAQKIEPLLTEIIVTRNGVDVWQGWLLRDVSFHRDTIIVNAHDILKWTERRILGNHNHTSVDLTTIALDYFADANLADLPFVIESSPAGVTATRKVLASEHRYASDPLGELYETGLDVTVVAGIVMLGHRVATCGTLYIRDSDIDGDPEIKSDGDLRATRVIIKGANNIVASFPLVPPDVCFNAADIVIEDDKILDQESADARAEELFERYSAAYPYFLNIPEGSGLSPKTPVHINALVPGNIFQVSSQSLCVQLSMALRLVAMDVEASEGSEQVRVTLEPLSDGGD